MACCNPDELLAYETVKVVKIQNWKLGGLYYFLFFCIFLYIAGWSVVWNKEYQVSSSTCFQLGLGNAGWGIGCTRIFLGVHEF